MQYTLSKAPQLSNFPISYLLNNAISSDNAITKERPTNGNAGFASNAEEKKNGKSFIKRIRFGVALKSMENGTSTYLLTKSRPCSEQLSPAALPSSKRRLADHHPGFELFVSAGGGGR